MDNKGTLLLQGECVSIEELGKAWQLYKLVGQLIQMEVGISMILEKVSTSVWAPLPKDLDPQY